MRLKPLGHPSQVGAPRPNTVPQRARRTHGARLNGRTDRERFELSIPRKRYAGFRDRCLQPLGHLSSRANKASQGKNGGQRMEIAGLDREKRSGLARKLHLVRHRGALTALHDEPHPTPLHFPNESWLGAVERKHVRPEHPDAIMRR